MPTRWRTLIHLLQLARLELVFAAISNCWLMIFLSKRIEPPLSSNQIIEDLPTAVGLLLGAMVGGGLAAYGLALNDLLDVRHDRAFAPQRPIAAGRIGVRGALTLAVMCLLIALFAGAFLGRDSVLLCLLAALAILFYNTTGRFFPAIGITTLGLIQAVTMLIPVPRAAFIWPVWLTMSHVMVCGAIVYHLEGKRPRLHGAELAALAAGWGFWSLVMLGWMGWREAVFLHSKPVVWTGPLVCLLLFVLLAWYMLHDRMRPRRSRRQLAPRFWRVALLWLIVYNAGWLFAANLHWQGLVLLALFAVAWGAVRLVSTLDELTGPSPSYRVSFDRSAPTKTGL